MTRSQLCDFVAQLVRALHRHRRGHGFEFTLSHLNFSGTWDNCLNCPASARIISSFDFGMYCYEHENNAPKIILVCYKLKYDLYCVKERLLHLQELKFQFCKLKHWSVEILTGLLGCRAWHNVKYKQSENNGDKAKKSEECHSLCKRDTSPA